MNSLPQSVDQRVARVRAFNRFYTTVIGVLQSGLLRTPYSVTEARVLFELAQRDSLEVTELRRLLGVDGGYLSRILSRFEADGLVARERSAHDGRRQVISLTKRGRASFETLDARSADEVRGILAPLGDDGQRRLVESMETIHELLDGRPPHKTVVLRPPSPGDLGWVVQRHGALYAQEYGWDETFEALVARIVADFAERRDTRNERAWIAEVAGDPVGCVFCVRRDAETAQLRLLLVEPAARGIGVGGRLLEEALRFARATGCSRVTLWTNDVLRDARRLYERAHFVLDSEEPHHRFGHDLLGQHWSLRL